MNGEPAPHAYDMMNVQPIRLDPYRAAPVRPHAVAGDYGPGAGGVVDLAPPRGIASPRTAAIMLTVVAVLGGIAIFGAWMLLWIVFSVWGTGESHSSALSTAAVLGLTTAGLGTLAAWAGYRGTDERPRVVVAGDSVSFRFSAYRRELVVPRANVRVVTVDSTPARLFHDNKLFPIAGALPDAVFADALDRGGDPFNPTNPPVEIPRDPAIVSPRPDADRAEHEPGWANAGPRSDPSGERGRFGYLYSSASGSALPLLHFNATDFPNTAIVFHEKVPLPPLRVSFNPFVWRSVFRLPRVVPGLLLKARDPNAVGAAFAPWGVYRPVTADDVLSQGLRPPKPAKGMRAVAAVALGLIPLILRIVLHSRHGFPFFKP